MKKIFLTSFLLLTCFLFLLPNLIQASDCPPCPSGMNKGLVPCGKSCYVDSATECNPCQPCDISKLLDNILDFVMKIVIIVGTLMLSVGGVMLLFAGADPGMLTKAKSIIKSTVIGLVVIFAAFLIVGTILNAIGLADWTANWYKNWIKGDFFEIPCNY